MVSAGLDTVPGNIIMGLAYLSTPHGQDIQAKALREIQEVYPDGDAWEKCLLERKGTLYHRSRKRDFEILDRDSHLFAQDMYQGYPIRRHRNSCWKYILHGE